MIKIASSKRRLKKEKKKFKWKLLLFLTCENINVSHQKICFSILFRIYMRVSRLKKYFDEIVIYGPANLIIEEHHRYIAYKIANKKFTIRAGTKCHHQTPPYLSIQNISIDYQEDWDKNSNFIIHQNYCKLNF
ncbi:hypothetical protein ACKUSY_03795 [Myroides odoratus]